MTNLTLYDSFDWTKFLQEYWQNKSGIFNDVLKEPLATPEEIFEGLLKVAEQYYQDCDKPTTSNTIERSRDGEQRIADIKFLTKKSRIIGDLHEYMPTRNDSNLKNYSKRLENVFGGTYLLYITNFYYYMPDAWRRTCDFLKNLYQVAGLPADYTDLELFIGTYPLTAGGIHRDRSSNFHFVVDGQKTMYVWPRQEFWKEGTPEHLKSRKLDKMHLNEYLEHGIAYKGQKGDMIYWQPNYWHAGSSEVYSASLVIAVNMNGQLSKLFVQGINNILKNKTINKIPAIELNKTFAQEELPEDFVEANQKILSDDKLLNNIRLSWLQHASNFGFKYKLKPRETVNILDTSEVVFSAFSSILCLRENDKIAIVSNGHILSFNYCREVEKLIEIINLKESLKINEIFAKILVSNSNQSSTIEILRNVISKLYSIYSLEINTQS